jgi:glycosyltransferase involved in cell wall biosynthesis
VKILFVLHTLTSGGAERVTALLANHWAREGHAVAVATMGAGEDFYPLEAAVARHRFDLSHPSGSPAEAVRGAWRRVRALRRLLADERPDVAIAMMTTWSVELALAGVGLPVRTIGSERIHPPTLPLGRAWEFLRRHAYRLLDGVVAQTEQSRRWIVEHTSARNVHVIPNPCEPPVASSPATVPGLAPDAPLLLAVGRLAPQKRFDRLIDALAAGPDTLGSWHLALVGTGPLEEQLRQRAADAGIAARVHLPGRTAAIEAWYARAQAFALTSDFEGFPNALLEAMAHGLAVVATDCPTGPADLIDDGRNGLLVPVGDDAALRQALAKIAGDPALREALGRAAGAVADTYSLPRIAARWETLFAAGRR